jgi:hypothetical protein
VKNPAASSKITKPPLGDSTFGIHAITQVLGALRDHSQLSNSQPEVEIVEHNSGLYWNPEIDVVVFRHDEREGKFIDS